MTASVTIGGQRTPIASKPTDTNEATIYTAGKEVPVVVALIICNGTGSAAAATVKWGDGSTDYAIIAGKSIPANDSVIYDMLLPLREGYTLKVTSGTGNALTFTFVIVSTGSTTYGQGAAA